ncbi:putative MFS transporter [Mycena latifolia]|nr:putative MFS transporter [Mycena latifolia]
MASPQVHDLEIEKQSVQEVNYGKHDFESQTDSYLHDSAAEVALVRKQDLRIVPLSAAMYLLCYLDRSNIDSHDVLPIYNLPTRSLRIALMVFLIAYAIFEVPSNYFLKKLSPSVTLTMGLGGTKSYGAVTATRFLLGAFEAGLFPGLVFYSTFWYKTDERSIRVAIILASATLAGAFGGAIAFGVGHMNQTNGLSAWRWLFILEGLPSCLSSVLVFFYLPDYPETAGWLTDEEKKLAARRLKGQSSLGTSKAMTWPDVKATLTDWRLYAHYAIYFGISTPFSSLSLFTPSITAGLGFTSLKANLMTVPPYAVAYVVTILVSWSADHFNARALHSAIMSLVGAAGFMASALLPADAYLHRYGCLLVASAGSFSCIPPLLGWLSSNVYSTSAAGLAIALNISLGVPGQIVGAWIYKANEAKRGYPTGHWTNAALLLFVATGCLLLLVYYRRLNSLMLKQGGEQRLYKL